MYIVFMILIWAVVLIIAMGTTWFACLIATYLICENKTDEEIRELVKKNLFIRFVLYRIETYCEKRGAD